jgi:lipopolysaccharide biosynthesis glycosyltransferase
MVLTTSKHPARIKIFVSTHKEATFPYGASILPIQVGCANTFARFENTLHDNDGDNISKLNPMYNELTAQYWAWKNADADYFGFCHYRRYFDFTGTKHKENDYGEIIDDYIDTNTITQYGLDDKTISNAIQGWDVITTPLNDVRKMGGFKDIKDHWGADEHLHLSDLRHMYDILCEKFPDYRTDADMVLNGHQAAFCNMFIMRSEIFKEYNEWLFPLLKAFTTTSDFTVADTQTLRTVGHLSERLLNIFIAHHQRVGAGWRLKRLQCVHFTHPEPDNELVPLDRNPRFTVPVVFAADDAYVPMLTTTIYSMLCHADPQRFYDIIVLEKNISDANKQDMQNFFNTFSYASIRFHNVTRAIRGFSFTTNNAHISIETYYRFIIQDVLAFYSKILYLDSDLIINEDISKLYDTNIAGNALGAIHDVDFLGNLNMKNGERAKYVKSVLNMSNGFHYFQAGVLVMNLERLRNIHSVEEWLELASDSKYIYNDQDILNMECEGAVQYLDYDWNVMHNNADRVHGVFAFAPDKVYKAYLDSRSHPKIVHYAGYDKPWKNPWCDFGPLYWHYAQETPFSLQLVSLIAGVSKPKPQAHHEHAISENNPIRKYADALVPVGSKQRELLKVTVRKLRKKK